MTDCERIIDLLSAYYDGELDNTERELVRKHLDECDSCAALLRVFGGVTDAFAGIEPPKELREQVMKSIPVPIRISTANTKRMLLWRLIPAAACLAFALIALPMLANSGKHENISTSGGATNENGADGSVMMPAAQTQPSSPRDSGIDDGENYDTYTNDDYSFSYSGDSDIAETGEADIQLAMGGKDDSVNESEEAAPPESMPVPAAEDSPLVGEAAPPDGNRMEETGSGNKDFDMYYAVIKIPGDAPPLLDGYERVDTGDGALRVFIPLDVARVLIEDGYDYVLYNEIAEEAVVILASPAGSAR